MNELDPGILTLIASCVGAVLFFCAGVYWNARPAPLPQAPLLPEEPPRRSSMVAPLRSTRAIHGIMDTSAPAKKSAVPQRPLAPEIPAKSTMPSSLRMVLGQLTEELGASSTLVVDEVGLLFTEGRDALGVGLCLSEQLAAHESFEGKNSRFSKAQSFELGELRLQRLPDPANEAWLASVGAERFASMDELQRAATALYVELGL